MLSRAKKHRKQYTKADAQ